MDEPVPDDDTGDGDGDGDGDGEPTGDGDGDGEPTGDGDGEPSGDGDGEPSGDGDGDAQTAECMVWQITYDLTGSQFILSDTPLGLGNQVNVVEEPYEADDHIGPGTMVLQFSNIDGAPSERAFMHSYEMALNFTVNATGARVQTDLDEAAGPEDCGITRGALADMTVAWDPSAIVGHRSKGQILCMGAFCNKANLPKNKPLKVDEVTDQPISDFMFDADLTGFTMAKTVIAKRPKSTTSWVYRGTEVDRELVAAPTCLCEGP